MRRSSEIEISEVRLAAIAEPRMRPMETPDPSAFLLVGMIGIWEVGGLRFVAEVIETYRDGFVRILDMENDSILETSEVNFCFEL